MRLRVFGVTLASLGIAATPAVGAPHWSLMAAAAPRRALGASLGGVSCASATWCMAVGRYRSIAKQERPFAERWGGKRWRLVSVAVPRIAGDTALSGVSCPSASDCVAVGLTGGPRDRPLIERWNGRKWVLQTPARATGRGMLSSIDCRSANNCIAVGEQFAGKHTVNPLAERWNGRKWVLAPAGRPSGTVGAALIGVSCPGASSCEAVGGSQATTKVQTLVQHWNGRKWTIQTSVNGSGAQLNILVGVTCTSARGCFAVGVFGNQTVQHTLAQRWNGSNWTFVPTPDPPGAESWLLGGVSCVFAAGCEAVGDQTRSGGLTFTLAERWNGSQWAIQPTPNPKLSPDSSLEAIACPSAKECIAVGSSGKPLAERYFG